MGLSAWNALRARQAELAKTLETSNKSTKETSTSPVNDGAEVEEKQSVEEEVKPKKKRK